MITVPADLVYGYWKNTLGQDSPVILEGVSGSVWSGQAAQASVSGQPVDKLSWRLSPVHLLLGNAEVALDFAMRNGFGKGQVGYSVFGSIYADNVEAWLPMDLVAPMVQLGSLKPGGALAVNLSELKVKNRILASAMGTIVWQDAEITILKPMPLGSLQVELEPADDGVKGVISDLGGPLEAQGLVTVDSEGNYDFSAEIAVRDPEQRDLANAIRSLGRQDRSGKVKLEQSGNLANLGF